SADRFPAARISEIPAAHPDRNRVGPAAGHPAVARHAATGGRRLAIAGEAEMTPLDKPIKRALSVGGKTYTLTIDPKDILSGDAGLAAALQASTAKLKAHSR